jgi:hypothetical protein
LWIFIDEGESALPAVIHSEALNAGWKKSPSDLMPCGQDGLLSAVDDRHRAAHTTECHGRLMAACEHLQTTSIEQDGEVYESDLSGQ